MPRAREVLRVLTLGDVDPAGTAADDHAAVNARFDAGIGERFRRRENGDA